MTHPTSPHRKPRLALMGEFSAGKSTLANLLLGQDSSPVQVTATQLPPVWYRQGPSQASRVDPDGTSHALPLTDWATARPADTQRIDVQLEADFLHACDLIDMPGTSDPNMVADFWQGILTQTDLVIWCTPANQAWRQSEAALWEQVPPHLWTKSLLLVTRMDKMQSDRDRARVLARVRHEAGPLFREVLPISLPAAIAGRDDDDVLEHTGAAALVQFLCTALEETDVVAPAPPVAAAQPAPKAQSDHSAPPAASPAEAPTSFRTGKIVPRRITRAKSGVGRPRPEMRTA